MHDDTGKLAITHGAATAERVATLVSDKRRAELIANGRRSARGEDIDPVPVVRLFSPDGNQSWLLTELDPVNGDTAYGLCDLGIGLPECGTVSLAELAERTGTAGMRVECDSTFPRDNGATLSFYDRAAHAAGRIVT